MNDNLDNTTPERPKNEFTTLVYEQELISPIDKMAAIISGDISNKVGLDVKVEVTSDKDQHETLSTYTALSERNSKTPLALFQGLHSIVTRGLEDNLHNAPDAETIVQAVSLKAETSVRQLTENPGLLEAFSKYYGGLRWSTDNERFISALFEHSVQFDADYIRDHASTSSLIYILGELDPEIGRDYKFYGEWSKRSTKEIIAAFPILDPSSLADPAIANSDEDVRLRSAYAQLKGQDMARQYTQASERINATHPTIPLTAFPLIEALMIDSVTNQNPRAKYDFSPSEVTDVVLDSDSVSAQRALVESLLYRLPPENRHVFDGPNELQQKHGVIRQIIRKFEREQQPERRDAFKTQLLQILEAYQGSGSMAMAVRQEHNEYSRDADNLKEITKSIMSVGLASNSPESFIRAYQGTQENASLAVSEEKDPLQLSQADLIEITLDALKNASKNSNAFAVEAFAAHAFGSKEVAGELRVIMETSIEAAKLFDLPSVHTARKGLKGYSFSSKRDDNARAIFDEATQPANELSFAASTRLNGFIIDRLETMIIDSTDEGANFSHEIADKLIKHVSYSSGSGFDFDTSELPPVYDAMKEILNDKNAPVSLKANLYFSMADATKYSGAHASYLDVVLDGYKAILGTPDGLSPIVYSSSSALFALNTIASSHAIFRYARVEQIEVLEQYKTEIIQLAGRLENGQLTDGARNDSSGEEDSSDIRNIQSVARELLNLEGQYEHYLHMEAVNENPHTYYQWALRVMSPFWSKMRWEMGPGQQPKQDISELYAVLEDHVKNKLVVLDEGQSLDENFDVIEDGHIDSLLYECYQRMIPRSNIQYNSTVWQVGMPFVHDAVRNMPKELAEQLIAKYPGSGFAQYIESAKKDKE